MRRARLAIDLGAESGRAMLAVLEGERLELHEVHRFSNRPLDLPSGLHWDIGALVGGVLEGLQRAAAHARANDLELVSVGVDAWGVDFALLTAAGELVGLPRCYRDPACVPAFERVVGRVGAARLYAATGIQLMPINTLYQLADRAERDPASLEAAERLLFIPDLVHHVLTGRTLVESTIASTSQMLDVRTGAWADGLLAELGLPRRLLAPVVPPGTDAGPVRASLAAAVAAPGELRVVLPAAHDTASAVAAVPATPGSSWCYISSGTWSLMGAELPTPCVTEAARRPPFTNELGVGGTVRFLKNIAGLWLLQESRRCLGAAGHDSFAADAGWERLLAAAEAASPCRTIVDPADPIFATPGDMPARLRDHARRTGQPEPETPGEVARCCLDSLAMSYRRTLRELETVLGRRFDVIHVVGGGGRNRLLNRLTAEATGRPVVVGPFEATSMGNALVQELGADAATPRLREIVRASVRPETFEPHASPRWEELEAAIASRGEGATS